MSVDHSEAVATTRPTQRVHIFIDNSNLWIEGQKAYAEKHKLNVSWDPTWRFDVGRLKTLLTKNTDLSVDREHCDIKINLYGSTPPPVDTVWTVIKSHDVHVSTSARSAWNKREKEVDAKINVDSVEKALIAKYEKARCDFIIVSGDRDLHPAVEKIKEYGFKVHIWSWKKALASVYTEDDGMNVYHLDDYLDDIGFRETTFRVDRKVISPFSIVVLDPLPHADAIQDYVKNLQVPVYQYVSPVKRDESSSQDLVIIPAFAARIEHGELTDLYKNAESTLGKCGLKVLTYAQYNQCYRQGATDETDDRLAVSNRFQEVHDNESDSDEDALEENENEDEDEDEVKDNDGFTRVNTCIAKKEKYLKRVEQKKHIWCYFRKYCRDGVKCPRGHTQQELDHFKVYGPKSLKKFKYCTNNKCLKGSKCLYAHGAGELFCPTCDKVGAGHEMTNCPERWGNRSQN